MYEEQLIELHKGNAPRPAPRVKLDYYNAPAPRPAPEERRAFKSTAELSIPNGDLDEVPENWL